MGMSTQLFHPPETSAESITNEILSSASPAVSPGQFAVLQAFQLLPSVLKL